MRVRTIKKISGLRGKKVLIRCDFNVGIENGKILDDFKLKQSLSTIEYLIQKKAKIILLTHLGRPDGRKNDKYSTKPIAVHLSKLLKQTVKHVDDCTGFKAGTALIALKEGEILLLENIRFEKEELRNSKKLAKSLAKMADIFVFNAFGVSHRQHASIVAIQNYLPSYGGLLLEKELENLDKTLKPKQPFVLVLGGVKLDTKLPLISKFLKKADKILIGGAMANNFLAAAGLEIGQSVADQKSINLAKKFKKDNILLPVDVIVGRKKRKWESHLASVNNVQVKDYIFDIGPKTINLYAKIIKEAKTVFWNGPMGMFEDNKYKYGTFGIARTVAARSRGSAFGIVGGGETVVALRQVKMLEYVDWVSTGGGAMLAYLSGQDMPGLKQLKISA
ncbi:MAG: phosphoglycerate kinase [Patescibacteria group bacterium]|nr:phosphoglycerate kinase [Patescibacteria group bacterium]